MQPKSLRGSTVAESFHFFWSGPFSQWHPSPFVIDGVTYNCAEQYMMAEKARLFGDTEREAMIMATAEPSDQKRYGRMVTGFNNAVWLKHAQAIVTRASFAKYEQNPGIRATLIATGTKAIVEASPSDKLWGIGIKASDPRAKNRVTWRGKNWLGQVLTEVRDVLTR